MSRLFLLADIKRHSLELTLLDRATFPPKTIAEKSFPTTTPHLLKENLKEHIGDFLRLQRGAPKLERRLVVGCFMFDDVLCKAMGIVMDTTKMNGIQHDAANDLTFVDKHELVALFDFTQASNFFEFNLRDLQPGHRGLIVSVGNHLQAYEEHVRTGQRKELIRINLGALSFSPHTEFDHEFSLFLRRDEKRTLKFSEFVTKAGFKVVYLFHTREAHGEVPKEPTYKELLQLISARNPIALKSVEYFLYLLAHFLYTGLVLLMLNRELILTGNFLRKMIAAFGDDDKVRKIFLDNLVCANHVKHTFDHLRISLQTNINDLVIKSAVQNF